MELRFPDRFFKVVRRIVHPTKLNQKQVDGINLIVSSYGGSDPRKLGNILGQCWRECRFILDIREVGRGRGKAYGIPHPKTGQVYYGRGPIQLTWYDNYLKFEKELGIPLTTKPDMVLIHKHGVEIMIRGMEKGMFTGKKLSNYFNTTAEDHYNARRIVNGLDHAREIEVDSWLFKLALVEGMIDLKLLED
jgi:putative chitinase